MMNLQSACSLLQHKSSIPKFPQTQFQNVSVAPKNIDRRYVRLQERTPFVQNGLKSNPSLSPKRGLIVYASNSSPPENLNNSKESKEKLNHGKESNEKLNRGKESKSVGVIRRYGFEPFRGKAGSVSFHGLTYQSVEESKLVSTPFEKKRGSFLWVLAPIALISSILLPRFFIAVAIDGLFESAIFAEIVSSLLSEVMFYIGLATFLGITDHVQKPYLQFSAKRWSLITGLKGYLTTAFYVMSFKIFAPLLVLCATWPALGMPSLVAVAPFLAGCLVQYLFEKALQRDESSSWPLVPIIFEVYRIYQLTRAVNFVDKLMFTMSDAPVTPASFDRNGAFVALIVLFQFLGITSLWSLFTFLQRLFPSRPVAENY